MTRSHAAKSCNGKKGGCKVCAAKNAFIKVLRKKERKENKAIAKRPTKQST